MEKFERLKGVSLRGVLASEVKFWEAGTGTKCASFTIRNDKVEIWLCKAFKEIADFSKQYLNEIGMKLSVRGRVPREVFAEEKEIIVDIIILPDKPLSWHEKVVKRYGSMRAYEQRELENREYMEAQGFVKIDVIDDGVKQAKWRKKKDIIIGVDGKPEDRIEYLMKVLGARYVTDRFLAWSRKIAPIQIPKGDGLSKAMSFENNGYEQLLNELFYEAETKLGRI